MARASSFDGSVSAWLEAEGIVSADAGGDVLGDVARVRALLVAAAREGRALSYSELLGQLGFRFTRPKMRAVCKTLDRIDAEAVDVGEPELAVLVVRESDGLPGQGWWLGARERYGYDGPWEGGAAAAFIRERQAISFAFWR
jgi:hypothetical protein